MENYKDFCTKSLIDNIIHHFIGNIQYKGVSVVRINNEKLSKDGELFFLYNFKAWKNQLTCERSCTNILQHFAHVHNTTIDNNITETNKLTKQIFEELISKSKNWPIQIQQCILKKEKVCLFLNRTDIMTNIIRMAIKHKETFGKTLIIGKIFNLKYHPDMQSDLTTWRLHLIKNITIKILNMHECTISDEELINKYMFTNKSQQSIDEGYEKYICGVVKNSHSNSKEINLTLEQYIKIKINQLAELNEYKLLESNMDNSTKNVFLHNLANAIVTFELMAVKPSRSVIIASNSEIDKNVSNTKGALFVLYNTARIASIRAKHNEKILQGDYPNLPDIENIDFSELCEEEEWELTYNFIFGYSQIINDCLRYEPNFQVCPHVICLFLSRLCHKFSVYYHRVKILMKGGDHLIPKMVARLYMIHALQIVLENALRILDIKPVLRM